MLVSSPPWELIGIISNRVLGALWRISEPCHHTFPTSSSQNCSAFQTVDTNRREGCSIDSPCAQCSHRGMRIFPEVVERFGCSSWTDVPVHLNFEVKYNFFPYGLRLTTLQLFAIGYFLSMKPCYNKVIHRAVLVHPLELVVTWFI